ncbi:unnamed protein product [Chrysoparadoxa australica]
MMHVNKGVIGIRVDAAREVILDGVEVKNLTNLALLGSELCSSIDENGTVVYQDHPKTSEQLSDEYGGAYTRGISIASSRKVRMVYSGIHDVTSLHGTAIGIDFIENTDDATINFSEVIGVHAATAFADLESQENVVGSPLTIEEIYKGPTALPLAIGFRVGPEAEEIYFNAETFADDLTSPYEAHDFFPKWADNTPEEPEPQESTEVVGAVEAVGGAP